MYQASTLDRSEVYVLLAGFPTGGVWGGPAMTAFLAPDSARGASRATTRTGLAAHPRAELGLWK